MIFFFFFNIMLMLLHFLRVGSLAFGVTEYYLMVKNSKTAAKMAVARIKLLKNKRQVVVKQMRRDIALLLQSGQDSTARIRVLTISLDPLSLFIYLFFLRGS